MNLAEDLGVTQEDVGELDPREAEKIGAEAIEQGTEDLLGMRKEQIKKGALTTSKGFLTIDVTLNQKKFHANVESILLLRDMDAVGRLSDAEMNLALERSSFYRANFVVAWATAKRIHKQAERDYHQWYAQMTHLMEDVIRKNRRRAGVTAMGISASQVEAEIMSDTERRATCITFQNAIDDAALDRDILEGVLDAISANGILLTSLAKRMLELRPLTVRE